VSAGRHSRHQKKSPKNALSKWGRLKISAQIQVLSMSKFRKGQSGNPSGKPRGCRNASTILFDELLRDNAKDLIEKAIAMAKGGDGPALRLCIDRLAPPRKDRRVWFELPKMNVSRDAVNASAAIVEAVSTGELTPVEAAELSKVVDSYARSLQTVEFEQRLSILEKAFANDKSHR
jgi:hypothetical protein